MRQWRDASFGLRSDSPYTPIRQPVTLPRVFGIEEGEGYVTVPFIMPRDEPGEGKRG